MPMPLGAYEPGGYQGTAGAYGRRAQAAVGRFTGWAGGRGRAAGIAGGAVAAYGAASDVAPNLMTAGMMGAGGYLGATRGPAALRRASRAGGRTGRAARAVRGAGLRAGRMGGRMGGIPRMRTAGGIAGAVGGMLLGKASQALFGKSRNYSTSVRSNYGYR